MSREVMIDIESLGMVPGSPVVSIGAVEFDPSTGTIGMSLHVAVSLTDCLLLGMQVDQGTVAWWKKQSSEAKASIIDGAVSLGVALSMLTAFLCDDDGNSIPGQTVWCNGGSFDFPILGAAFRACNLSQPWEFWQERDCRTLVNVCRDVYGYKKPSNEGVAHNAKADAAYQARMVMDCLALLRNGIAREAA